MTRRPAAVWALWLGLYVITTLLLVKVSALPDVRISHGVLCYLVLIIGASRHGGRALSAVMVLLGYLAVDWFFVPPRFTLGGSHPLDWFILVGFILTGLLISELFVNLQRAVRVAKERTEEAEQLGRERLQLEREASTARVLLEADRLKNALINSIAHDLRSPIATLSLLSDPVGGFRPDVALQRVREETQRLGEFIATLQQFATKEGEVVLTTDTHNAADLVQTALRMTEARLVQREVRVRPHDQPLHVRGDRTLSLHILGNLLQNAARYAPATQPIDISMTDGADRVEITVADRGPGIAVANLERIFSPLRRPLPPHPATDTDVRMGMGLAIARTFARAQQGEVSYRARTGGGSEFVLRLPRAVAGAIARNPTSVDASPAPAS